MVRERFVAVMGRSLEPPTTDIGASPLRTARPHVVILGGGFAGLNAAHALRAADGDVTLVDKHNFHTFQPLLYQVATGYLAVDEVGTALRHVFRRQPNVTLRTGTVTGVNFETRAITFSEGDHLEFDYLIVACGAVASFFDVQGMDEHGWPLYTLPDAFELRMHLLATLEVAARSGPNVAELTTVVVGGGPTGVETAGALATMAQELVGPGVRLKVVLVEAGDRLLGGFDESSSRRALDHLVRRGVEVRLQTPVKSADARGLALLGGERIDSTTVIWAAGVRAAELSGTLGVELDRAGRICVGTDLGIPGHPGCFAAGDIAAVRDPHTGSSLAMLAPAAIQTGEFAGMQVARHIANAPPTPFRFRDKGMMAVLGRGDAVAELPVPGIGGRWTWRLAGRPAWLLWLGVHVVYLIGFRNRIRVLVDWGWNYFTSRGAGAILLEPADPRDPWRTPGRSTR